MFAPMRPSPTIPNSITPILWAGIACDRMPKANAKPSDKAADVLTIFGITGDLAKKMTFRALYRLESRGKLDCPIVGVAIDEWSVEKLREHAREAIAATVEDPDEDVFSRLAARFSYVQGDYADAATFERVGEAIGDAERRVFYLEVPPALFATVVQGLGDCRPHRQRPGRDREAVRSRPGLCARRSTTSCSRCSARTRSCGSTTSSARSR